MSQCPSCGGDCGYTKWRGCQYEEKSVRNRYADTAFQFADRLALELECVLADYHGRYYDSALDALAAYRTEMNIIDQDVSPTFLGEPLEKRE